MINPDYVTYLFRFMLCFEIDRFTILDVSHDRIRAIIGWPYDGREDYDPDEEVQEIEWEIQRFPNYETVFQITELLQRNDLLNNDKITVEETQLFQMLTMNRNDFDNAIETLLKIKVDMIDDGKKSDYFFLHF